MQTDVDDRRGAGSVRARDRLVARVGAAKLDRALAGGARPESSPALTLRAEALTSARMRRALWRSLDRIVAQRSRSRPLGARLSPRRERVEEARDDLAELALLLRVSSAADPRGVARARQLLTDGGGPLFWTRSDEDLKAKVRNAIASL